VSAGGLVSRILVSAITTQSRTAKGIAMLNLQVLSNTIPVCDESFLTNLMSNTVSGQVVAAHQAHVVRMCFPLRRTEMKCRLSHRYGYRACPEAYTAQSAERCTGVNNHRGQYCMHECLDPRAASSSLHRREIIGVSGMCAPILVGQTGRAWMFHMLSFLLQPRVLCW
jgi:hypothetical protein